MTRVTVVAGILSVCLLGLGSVARADPVSVGALLRLYDGPGGNNGGEFYADVTPFGGSAPYDFITFCLQRNEYFSWGQSLYIGDISTAVQAGGDPISPETAYLYTGFRSGNLPNYAFGGSIMFNGTTYNRNSTATALQAAFWLLENEDMTGVAINGLTNYYVDQARSAVSSKAWTGIGDVRVLNLYGSYDAASGTYSGNKQDQLVIHSVPEPSTLSLLGLGLFVAARLVKRGRSAR